MLNENCIAAVALKEKNPLEIMNETQSESTQQNKM